MCVVYMCVGVHVCGVLYMYVYMVNTACMYVCGGVLLYVWEVARMEGMLCVCVWCVQRYFDDACTLYTRYMC